MVGCSDCHRKANSIKDQAGSNLREEDYEGHSFEAEGPEDFSQVTHVIHGRIGFYTYVTIAHLVWSYC